MPNVPSSTARQTPGVYIPEVDTLSTSVVGAPPAFPIFLGYTQMAPMDERSVITGETSVSKVAVPIRSLTEYKQIFGKGAPVLYDVVQASATQLADVTIDGTGYTVEPAATHPRFLLYNSLQLYFANGAGPCQVVSAGLYGAAVTLAELQDALDTANSSLGPAILVTPDAVLLPADGTTSASHNGSCIRTSSAFNTFVQSMLSQCAALQDRLALLDLYDADAVTATNISENLPACVETFQNDLALVTPAGASFGAAYFPFLNTTIVSPANFTADNLALPSHPFTAHHLQQLLTVVAKKENRLPPSAAMASVFVKVDEAQGVWSAPANISLNSVTSPTVSVSDTQMSSLTLPANGYAVNVIRHMANRGTVVWGARTLDGNSPDYRYIHVRRTLIYIEMSIKLALRAYVFAPNVSATWLQVMSSISTFLTQLWDQGGLFGSKASEAFTVQCGLGSTMTAQNILDGYMIVDLKLQVVAPSEFVELTFTQILES